MADANVTSTMSDWNLVQWATRHGWTFFWTNDQLRDPQGYLVTFNRQALDSRTRERILQQMERQRG